MTNHTQPISGRSLLTSNPDSTTVQFTGYSEIRTKGYIWTALRSFFPEELVESVRGMSLTADSCGAVFDVPNTYIQHVEEVIQSQTSRKRGEFAIPTSLPELKDQPQPNNQTNGKTPRWQGNGNNRGNFQDRNRGNGSGRGRGRGKPNGRRF